MAQIPKAWQELMDQQGISSIRELARIAGVTTSTGTPDHTRVNAVIMKGEDTSEENMRKVAAALKVPVEELYRIKSGVAATPISIPFGTEKLSERQKNAVTELIRTMVEEKEHAKGIVDKKSPQPAEPNPKQHHPPRGPRAAQGDRNEQEKDHDRSRVGRTARPVGCPR